MFFLCLLIKLFRGHPSQRAVRAFLIIDDPPFFNQDPCVRHGEKAVIVQAFFPVFVVEALDIRVFGWFPRRDEVKLDTTLIRPGIQRPADTLRPVIDRDIFRAAHASSVKTPITLTALIDVSTSILKHLRVYSSKMGSVLSFRPFVKASKMKSIAHTWLIRSALGGGILEALERFTRLRFLIWSFSRA